MRKMWIAVMVFGAVLCGSGMVGASDDKMPQTVERAALEILGQGLDGIKAAVAEFTAPALNENQAESNLTRSGSTPCKDPNDPTDPCPWWGNRPTPPYNPPNPYPRAGYVCYAYPWNGGGAIYPQNPVFYQNRWEAENEAKRHCESYYGACNVPVGACTWRSW